MLTRAHSKELPSVWKNLKAPQGVTLITVLGLLFLITLLVATSVRAVLTLSQAVGRVESANAAYFAAESGVELALYDLAAYQAGYETNKTDPVCGPGVDLTRTENFSATCNETNRYRFVDFIANQASLSQARAFWQVFARAPLDLTAPAAAEYVLPNPLFVGNRDGKLASSEFGRLSKEEPLHLSLLIDEKPLATEPRLRYLPTSLQAKQKIIFQLADNFDPKFNGNSADPLLIWTLSAINAEGEFTLQGIINEADFDQNKSFSFNLADELTSPNNSNGEALIGENINRRSFNGPEKIAHAKFNRISGQVEDFSYALPGDFLSELKNSFNQMDKAQQWSHAELSVNLIATLAETSDIPSNILHYKITSSEEFADEQTYIVSEGFAGNIKQTIITRFKRQATMPIFTYAVFQ